MEKHKRCPECEYGRIYEGSTMLTGGLDLCPQCAYDRRSCFMKTDYDRQQKQRLKSFTWRKTIFSWLVIFIAFIAICVNPWIQLIFMLLFISAMTGLIGVLGDLYQKRKVCIWRYKQHYIAGEAGRYLDRDIKNYVWRQYKKEELRTAIIQNKEYDRKQRELAQQKTVRIKQYYRRKPKRK